MEYINTVNQKYKEIASREIIYPMFRVELLDHMENILSDITDDISENNSGSISINYQQGVRRTCHLSLIDTDGYFLNQIIKYQWMNNKIKIYIGLKDIENNDIYWFSQGIYHIMNPSINRTEKSIEFDGVDKYGFLGGETGYNQITSTHVIPVDTKILYAVQDTLMLELGNGYILDPKQPIVDNTLIEYRSPYEINKAPLSYLSDIFIEFGNVMGADTYYDVDGHMRYDNGTLDISYSFQDSIWDFEDVLPEYIDSSLQIMTTDTVNSVTIVGNNSSMDMFWTYTAENHNPISPTSIENIGRKSYYEESASVYDDSTARDYAEYVLNQKSILQQALSFNATLIPHLDVNKVITITDSHYNYNRERFIIQSLEIPLTSTESMQITASQISSLPYYEWREGGSE